MSFSFFLLRVLTVQTCPLRRTLRLAAWRRRLSGGKCKRQTGGDEEGGESWGAHASRAMRLVVDVVSPGAASECLARQGELRHFALLARMLEVDTTTASRPQPNQDRRERAGYYFQDEQNSDRSVGDSRRGPVELLGHSLDGAIRTCPLCTPLQEDAAGGPNRTSEARRQAHLTLNRLFFFLSFPFIKGGDNANTGAVLFRVTPQPSMSGRLLCALCALCALAVLNAMSKPSRAIMDSAPTWPEGGATGLLPRIHHVHPDSTWDRDTERQKLPLTFGVVQLPPSRMVSPPFSSWLLTLFTPLGFISDRPSLSHCNCAAINSCQQCKRPLDAFPTPHHGRHAQGIH